MGVSTWMMSHWTLQVSNWQVIGPVMLNGVGGGLLRSATFPQSP